MTTVGLLALLPLIVLSLGAVVAMLVISLRRSHALIFGITLVTLVLAFLAIFPATNQASGPVTTLLVMDHYAYFIIGLIIVACVAVTLFAYGYFKIQPVHPEEFYLLLLLAALGSCVLAASSHFISLFIGLEILSISLYAMISYAYRQPTGIEAGIKYLILASSSAAFMLFGMALVYSQLGTMEFSKIAASIAAPASLSLLLTTGLVMMMVGFGFKLALVPFHLWTPDVYEGAPAPVTAFIASISKGSMFAVLLRFYYPFNIPGQPAMMTVFVIIAVATMLIGSLLALLQNNLKRLLAYSSIANLGYLLVAFLSSTHAVAASSFYLVSYFITILAAFGVVTVLSGSQQEASGLDNYRGLMWRRPWLAAVLTVAMFSLAGLPLTVGFVGKFYLVLAGIGSALWLLVVVLVLSSAIGLYYYLRVVVIMFSPLPEHPAAELRAAESRPPSLALGSGLALAVLLVLLVWLGVFPAQFINMLQSLALATR